MSTTVVVAAFRVRLSQVIRSFGSVVDLANAVGVSDNAIYKWLAGRGQPSVSNLIAVARAGKVSVEWLATGLEPRATGRPRTRATDRGDFVFMRRKRIRVPGAHNEVIHSDQVVDWMAFRSPWLRRHFNTEPGDLILIEVIGDSMAPTVKDSDLILADLGEPRFRQDGIYLMRQEGGQERQASSRSGERLAGGPSGGLSVKRVQRRPDGQLSVRCDNPAYEAITVPAKIIRILGRVVWIGSRL